MDDKHASGEFYAEQLKGDDSEREALKSEEDKYGNPIDGDRLIYCCYPDCGCDGARLCMAETGASDRACKNNVEGMYHTTNGGARMRAFADIMEEK